VNYFKLQLGATCSIQRSFYLWRASAFVEMIGPVGRSTLWSNERKTAFHPGTYLILRHLLLG